MKNSIGITNKKSRIGFSLIFILVLFLLTGCLSNQKQPENSSEKQEEKADSNENNAKEEPQKEPDYEEKTGTEDFAIFGVDTRATNLNSGTRSDSIMIVHVDHNEKQVKIASVYRDCMVHIEGHDYQKITHAHSFGGPELALQTVNENFDLDLEHYMTVNFINVGDLIDDVGGVEQDVTEKEASVINTFIDQINRIRKTSSSHIDSEGTYTLDGTQAVAYSRIRSTAGGDYKRAERQRTILFKVFEKAKDMNTLERLDMADKMLAQINTNFVSDDISSLLYYLSQYEITDMTAFPQVFYGGIVDGAWVEVPITLKDMDISLHEFLYEDTEYVPSERVEEYSNVLYGKASTPNEDLREEEE